MHRTLWLLRHAEAAHPLFGQSDDQRPLTPSGAADVVNLVSFLTQENATPVQWLWLSPALRTRQTAEPITQLWDCESVEDATLYVSDPFALLHCLQTTPADYQHIALVGHNPGISQLAHYLTVPSDQVAVDVELPPLGTVQLAFQGNWQDLRLGACSVESYITPSRLAADR
jgi:phosphohistidine phosphatase